MQRQFYFVLRRQFFLPPLLWGTVDQLKHPFQRLRSPTLVNDFVKARFIRDFWLEPGQQERPGKAPFVPFLGPFLISRHTLPYHEDLKKRGAERRLPALTPTAGVDQSLLPIPLTIEPKHRLDVSVPNSDLAAAGVRSTARLYLQLFAFGLCTCFVCVSVTALEPMPLESIIRLMQQLSGRRSFHGTATYSLHGTPFAGPASTFSKGVVQHVARSLAGVTRNADVEDVSDSFVIVLARDPPDLEDKEITGLLTLDERYQSLSKQFAASKTSLFGRYEADLVVPSVGGLLVNVSPSFFSRLHRGQWTWMLITVMELARTQKSIFPRIQRQLSKFLGVQPSGIREADALAISRASKLMRQLQAFPAGLPDQHRAWYRRCEEVLGLAEVKKDWQELERQLIDTKRSMDLRKEVKKVKGVHITISNSQVGTVNLGTIIGDVQNHLNSLRGPSSEEVKRALHSTAQAIVDDPKLNAEEKEQWLQHVDFLAQGAAKKPEQRSRGLIKTTFDALTKGLALATSAAQTWSVCAPIVAGFFGMPTG